MKTPLVSIAMALALTVATRAADVTVKISDVHLCCGSCVKIAQKVVGTVDGAKADVSEDDGTITITGPDKATVQKVADALVAAGFFGTSSDPSVKIDADTGAKGQKVQTMTITGLHLCCGKCVNAVHKTLLSVPGVTGDTAAKNVKTFTVTGDFNDKDVMDALQKAGLTGKVED
jgi:periplasmic mercuric ion binding protein